jgi:hypothetical protein
MNPEEPIISDWSPTQWDSDVLNLIGDEGFTRFTFDGLKRRLGVHSETLSRVLVRLEDQGIIERLQGGYSVTAKARKFFSLQPLNSVEAPIQLLQTLLPPDVPIRQLVSDLSGKWFGSLRWLGYAKNDGSTTLKWITEDGGIQVDATFSEGALRIDAKLLLDQDLNLAIEASYQLMGHISKLFAGAGKFRPVVFFTRFSSNAAWDWA